MQNRRKFARLAIPVAFCLIAAVVMVKRSSASVGNITKADLTGPWQVSLYGQGGCGVGTAQVNFTLNAAGTTSAAISKSHNVGCGDTTTTGNTFTIMSLSTNGSGTAGLSCGTGCGFTFAIQVSPDRSTFTLVDITDPANFQLGTAVHQ